MDNLEKAFEILNVQLSEIEEYGKLVITTSRAIGKTTDDAIIDYMNICIYV